jgi:D-alanyl-D-alanine dipeptidase
MRRFALVISALLLLPPSATRAAETDLSKVPGLEDAASKIEQLQVEMKYSTTDNFLGKDLYGDLEKCYLQTEAVAMLAKAAKNLQAMRPDLRLLAYDCVRPVSVQRQMWKVVKGTPQQHYVANPNTKTGSIHNYGCAVDLTIADKDGKPIDLGTPFDFFGKAAQPRHEFTLLKTGKLTHAQWANRLLLREVMVRAGFIPIASEWWHFNCAPNHVARKKFKKVP